MSGEGKEAEQKGNVGTPSVAAMEGCGGVGAGDGGAGGIGSAIDRGASAAVRGEEVLGTVQQLVKLNSDRSSITPTLSARVLFSPLLSRARSVPAVGCHSLPHARGVRTGVRMRARAVSRKQMLRVVVDRLSLNPKPETLSPKP